MRFFQTHEVTCKCGCGMIPQPSLLATLDSLRLHLGVPLVVASGARCAAYNRKVGGALGSYHVRGLAVDVMWPAYCAKEQLFGQAYREGFVGFGLYPSFVHLDLRDDRAFWIG